MFIIFLNFPIPIIVRCQFREVLRRKNWGFTLELLHIWKGIYIFFFWDFMDEYSNWLKKMWSLTIARELIKISCLLIKFPDRF